jgi:hypothetical protein
MIDAEYDRLSNYILICRLDGYSSHRIFALSLSRSDTKSFVVVPSLCYLIYLGDASPYFSDVEVF